MKDWYNNPPEEEEIPECCSDFMSGTVLTGFVCHNCGHTVPAFVPDEKAIAAEHEAEQKLEIESEAMWAEMEQDILSKKMLDSQGGKV